MQRTNENTSTLNLKALLLAELGFLAFCIWFGTLLYYQTELTVWYSSQAKLVLTLLMIATLPGQALLRFNWHRLSRAIVQSARVVLLAVVILGAMLTTCSIQGAQNIFVAAIVATTSAVIVNGFFWPVRQPPAE